MNENSIGNKRIAKNTILLYMRMFITMGIALYTSRVVLNTLGVDDFGVYNVVAGFVAMFGLISGSLNSASQRFLTYEMGRGDKKQLSSVFCTAVNIHIFIAIIVMLAGQTFGLWFLNSGLNIPLDKMYAANCVFQCSLMSFMLMLTTVPYKATIVSYERFDVFAYVEIAHAVLKLVIVYMITISPFDKLISYALLMVVVDLLVNCFYILYCRFNFEICKYKLGWNKDVLKEMLSFSGWNLMGVGGAVLKTQGTNILINIFFGVALNAVYGIANQINNAISMFASNVGTAINPQITKAYACNDTKRMESLISNGTKLVSLLLLLLIIPILFETEIILAIWLKNVPDYTVIFVRLLLLELIINSFSIFIVTAIVATGKVREFQLYVESLILLNIPIVYILYNLDCPSYSYILTSIVISMVLFVLRLRTVNKLTNFSSVTFLSHIIFRILLVFLLSIIIPIIITTIFESSVYRLILTTIVSSISTLLLIYFVGLSKIEKQFFKDKLKERNSR